MGYLQDFLFSPDRARSPVRFLSGGERNRLLLARIFTQPSNLLILDEPTNDLDMETLELLEEKLLEYQGTLLLVSHDRAFLNNVVTSTLIFEGEGKVREVIGDYDHDEAQKASIPSKGPEKTKKKKKKLPARRARTPRLSYREQEELKALPRKIDQMEARISELHQTMAAPAFYQQDEDQIIQIQAQLRSLEQELADAYKRWEALEGREG
jgi:ATP-binding cassette subfamily F protein uup